MANRYVYSGAAGAGTGADWANAHLTLTAAITASTAGDKFFVAHDHNETQASTKLLSFKGHWLTNADIVLCVNRAGSVPPVSADLRTTAIVAVTGTNEIQIEGMFYIYGIQFLGGTGTSAANIGMASSALPQEFEQCSFQLRNTSASSMILLSYGNAAHGSARWVNCTVSFANAGQTIAGNGHCRFYWVNDPSVAPLYAGSTVTNYFMICAQYLLTVDIVGLDLTAWSGKQLTQAGGPTVRFINCKLPSSIILAEAPPNTGVQARADFIGCSSASNVARNERWTYGGILTTELTIKRTGGASDGITPYAWKQTTSPFNQPGLILPTTFEGTIWNTTVGSTKTLTVYTVTDGVTLTNDDIWLEVDYLGNSSTPNTTLVASKVADALATPVNYATSTETWTTTGLSSPIKQKLEVTFTPAMIGAINWRIKTKKRSATVYICPKAVLS